MPTPLSTYVRRVAAALVLLGLAPGAHAQSPSSQPPVRTFTLEQALTYATEHAPAIREAVARADAAQADVARTRSAYLPHLDAVWQASRATANNVFGQVLPHAVIPAMSGPVLAEASPSSVWGSAAGALLSWQALDFGQRRAAVNAADAASLERLTEHALTTFEVQVAVATAFLDVAAAQQAVTAADADLKRREVMSQVTATLVANELRPGAERTRADAERAAARTRVAQAKQAVTLARIALGRALGMSDDVPTIDATPLTRAGAQSGPDRMPAPGGNHPAVVAAIAAATAARDREEVVRRSDRPQLLVQSALFARGTGANPDGRFDRTGLWFERANWASGVQFVLPNLFAGPSLRARRAAASALTRAEYARAEQASLVVSSTRRAADAMMDAALEIAVNTQEQVDAARVGETQARARYDAGLAVLTEVAEAQGLLASAEYQDALADLGVWRARLARAAAAGDLSPLLAELRATDGGGR